MKTVDKFRRFVNCYIFRILQLLFIRTQNNKSHFTFLWCLYSVLSFLLNILGGSICKSTLKEELILKFLGYLSYIWRQTSVKCALLNFARSHCWKILGIKIETKKLLLQLHVIFNCEGCKLTSKYLIKLKYCEKKYFFYYNAFVY